jgi:hypothetical protein
MDEHNETPERARSMACQFASWLTAASLAAVLTVGGVVPDAQAEGKEKLKAGDTVEVPFKLARIYFETNASACDMGIQIVFDTEGIKSGKFSDPDGKTIHEIRARTGLEAIGGQTEGFLEGVEPLILELVDAADAACDPEPGDLLDAISLEDVREFFPAGLYEFEGNSVDGEYFDGEAELTYDIPDGPVLGAPDGEDDVDADAALEITWSPVTMTIPGLLPGGAQVPVTIIGYQVLVFDGNAGEAPQEFNVTVPGDQTSVTVPAQFLQPDTEYEIEVLAIEQSFNQTITEGSFTTAPAP